MVTEVRVHWRSLSKQHRDEAPKIHVEIDVNKYAYNFVTKCPRSLC